MSATQDPTTPAECADVILKVWKRHVGLMRVSLALSVFLFVDGLFKDARIRNLRRSQDNLLAIAKGHREGQSNLTESFGMLSQSFAILHTNHNWLASTTAGALTNTLGAVRRLDSNQNAIGWGLTLHLMRYEQEHPREFGRTDRTFQTVGEARQ